MESGGVLYMALELSAKQWHLVFGVGPGTRLRRRMIAAGDGTALRGELAAARRRFGLAPTAAVRSCYEAGRDGFWVHRLLTRGGVANLVVDSSSIEVSRRARRAKTDRLDAEHLLRLLWRYWAGERTAWHVVHVPSVAVEDARQSDRWIGTLVQERTRWRNRVKGLLAVQGVRVRLTARFPTALTTCRTGDDRPLPAGWLARVRRSWAQLAAVQTQLRDARRAQRAAIRAAHAGARPAGPSAPPTPERLAAQVHALRGIGAGSALTLATEVFSRDLHNRREVGALSGLTPVPYQSGTRARDQGISRAGLRRVRGLLVELAWQWVKYQPTSALTQWFLRRFGVGARPRKVGIVALARRLLIALWHYTRTGALPDGAELRRAA
jgi:transposase